MGNAIFTSRIKGITMHYAKDHMSDYHKGDFLRIVPDFNNPYDNHALAIYDDNKHMIGFADKHWNTYLYDLIKNNDYVCLITSVYIDSLKPSIEYQVIYKTDGTKFEISEYTFNDFLTKYNHAQCDFSLISNDAKDKIIIRKKSKKREKKENNLKKNKYIILNYTEYYAFLEELKKFNSKIIYIYHKKFGLGKVVVVSKNFVTVKFDSVGDKTFKFPESINVYLFKAEI